MRISYYTIFFLLISIGANAQIYKEHIKTIDKFLSKEYSKEDPGVTVLIAQNGDVLYKNAFGLASLKPKRKMKVDMVFQVASITKQFVSAAILKLIEEGKMSLEDTIQKYVPYYPSKKHPITIHHLLSQTSGIPEYFILEENELHLLAKEHTPKELISYYKDTPLSFKPGEKWQYSNSNYPLLGAALEKATGLSLKDYLRINFFDPLEMTSSGLWYNDNIKEKRIPVGYNYNEEGLFPAPKIIGSAMYAAGGIVSTINDLFIWNRALKNNTSLSKFIVEGLTTENTTNSGEGTGYGYGFFLNHINGSATIQHGGNLYGFTSTALYLPNEDIFICILSNKKYDRTEEISDYIASLLINKPLEIFASKEISKEQLKDYVGIYEMQNEDISRTFEIKIFKDKILLSDPKEPESSAFLTPAGKDVLILKVASAYFKFTRDAQNVIDGYTVKQNDETFTFKKVN